MNAHNLLVFTDMDGSLLDHHDYSHAPADALLLELERLNIPVIANTSKTRAELEKLKTELHNKHPFVSENGAAVFLPKNTFHDQPEGTDSDENYWVKSFSEPRTHWQSLIDGLEADYAGEFTTFAKSGIDGIMDMTGLDRESAERSSIREFGEPVKWLGSEEDKATFFSKLEAKGAQILHGGRFSHVSGESDKGKALVWLRQVYENTFNEGQPLLTLGLGDSQNDVAMLDAADYAVIIKSPTHSAPSLHTQKDKLAQKRLLVTSEVGPHGWKQGLEWALQSLENT